MTKLLASVLVILIALTGCSKNEDLTYKRSQKVQHRFDSNNKEIVFIDYNSVCDEAVNSMLSKIELPKKIIVTDFVDITSLENKRKLGYVLSNSIKNSLINKYNTDVVEVEVSKYFKISGNGVKILSRDVDKLRSTNFDVRYAIVGTYTHTNSELIIFTKLIDLKTGIIKGSYANTFPMGEGTKMMLQTK